MSDNEDSEDMSSDASNAPLQSYQVASQNLTASALTAHINLHIHDINLS